MNFRRPWIHARISRLRLCVTLFLLCSTNLAWANPEYYVESPSSPTREEAEAHRASIPSLGEGIEARVIRRFRVGEGWAYVVRVDYLELDQARTVADALGNDESPGVIYRRIGSRTVRVLDAGEPTLAEEVTEPSSSEASEVMEDPEIAEDETSEETVSVDDATSSEEVVPEPVGDTTLVEPEVDIEPRLRSPDSILRRAVRAHGGAGGGHQRIEGAGSVRFVYVRTVGIDDETVVVNHEYLRWGEGLRLDVEIQEGEGVDSLTVVDRSGEAWVSTGGEVVDRDRERTIEVLADYGPSEILGVSMQVARHVAEDDRWSELTLVETQASPGGERVELRMPEGTGRGLQALSFDAARSLLVAATWNTMDGVVRMGFEDYRFSDNDLVYPGRVTVWLDDAIMERIVVTDLRLNPSVEADLFERPSGASPN